MGNLECRFLNCSQYRFVPLSTVIF